MGEFVHFEQLDFSCLGKPKACVREIYPGSILVTGVVGTKSITGVMGTKSSSK